MTECQTHLELVRQAQAGSRDATSALVERVRERVFPFINRTLLDPDKSEDLTQETVLAVLESLGNLRAPERFWSWVFTIATSQVRQYFRHRSRSGALQMLEIGLQPSKDPSDEGFALASQKELGELTRAAMSQLGLNHRMVLSLRFYEDMPHAEIAQVLGCNELAARMRFFNAKRALERELRRLGVSRNSLLAALGAFGVLTLAPSAKATTVHVSTAAAGEGLASLLTCVPGRIAALAACLAAVVAMGALATQNHAAPQTPQAMPVVGPPTDQSLTGPGARYVHFNTTRAMPSETAARDARYKFWYLYPEGVAGAVLMRVEIWDTQQSLLKGWVLQTSEACYKANLRTGTIRICNYGLLEGMTDYNSLLTLPTDPQAMADFAVTVEGEQSVALGSKPSWMSTGFNFHRDPRTGYVIEHEETNPQGRNEVVRYDYSPFDGRLFAFTCPPGMKVTDQRDELYKRGWVCFEVTGELAGEPVEGLGRLPMTYAASRSHQPFLQMKIGGITVVDRNTDALLVERGTGTAAPFVGCSFFRGLARPWMGFTAADTIRRDAAKEQVWYSNPYSRDDDQAEFTILKDGKPTGDSLMAKYLIDRRRGLVERIEYRQATNNTYGKDLGHLLFSYKTDAAAVEAAISLLPAPTAAARPVQETDVFWPIHITDRRPHSPAGMALAGPAEGK